MSVSLTLKGVPRELNAALNAAARQHRRSKNAETILWLEERAQWQPSARHDPAQLRREARALARKFTVRLSEAEYRRLVREGRP